MSTFGKFYIWFIHELVQIFTSGKSSWYPEPEHDIPLSALPSIPPLPDEKLSQKEIGQMPDYALTYGAAVRQRTNRQETTMARHGTMPELIYQRQLEISTDKVDVSTGIGRRSSMPSTDTETSNDEIENAAISDLTRYRSMTAVLMKSKSRKVLLFWN